MKKPGMRFPRTFWVSNTLEIFERMAWYGFYAVSSLYITGPVAEGGLGFSDEDRGIIQAVVTFFLYLFPAVTGALADRFGFKRMLVIAFIVLTPSYFLLGQFSGFTAFFIAFMMVALGAAIFKPVIIASVSKTTNRETGTLGFGIFYMMVNIGGFLGPIAAGILRSWDWQYVFLASSGWIAINFLVVLFYKEPDTEACTPAANEKPPFFANIVEVLGNGRFFLTVAVVLFLLVIGSKLDTIGLPWSLVLLLCLVWIGANLIYDYILRRSKVQATHWLLETMHIGDKKFAVFLLLMAGFWSAYNQLFITLPLYIRDYTDTASLLHFSIDSLALLGISGWAEQLRQYTLAGGQVNPEYLININALAIIFLQVGVSLLARKLRAFTTIFMGVSITALSFLTFVFGASGWIVVLGISIFSIGEMLASPKAKEYTGNIAPANKVAMYMGYFYWCVALGNLFGGILSGQMYALFARDMQRPDLMWVIFALISLLTGVAIYIFNWYLRRQAAAEQRNA
jgi:POT family proton-dependent oligopeptide transporter